MDEGLKVIIVIIAVLGGLLGWLIYRDEHANSVCARNGYQQKVEINGNFYCVESAVWIGGLE